MEASPKHAAPPIETATRIRRHVSAAVSGYEALRAPGRDDSAASISPWGSRTLRTGKGCHKRLTP